MPRIQSCQGLVKQQIPVPARGHRTQALHDRAGKLGKTLLASGNLAEHPLGHSRQISLRERLINPAADQFRRGAGKRIGAHRDQFTDGEIKRKTSLLGHHGTQVRLGVRIKAIERRTVQVDRAGLRDKFAGERRDERGFTRPVRAKQAEQFAAIEFEADRREHRACAPVQREAARLDRHDRGRCLA